MPESRESLKLTRTNAFVNEESSEDEDGSTKNKKNIYTKNLAGNLSKFRESVVSCVKLKSTDGISISYYKYYLIRSTLRSIKKFTRTVHSISTSACTV